LALYAHFCLACPYQALAERNDGLIVFCRSRVRRPYELAAARPASIARETLERITGLYAIEKEIRGRSAEEQRAVRGREPPDP
jgi:hypothetical protein